MDAVTISRDAMLALMQSSEAYLRYLQNNEDDWPEDSEEAEEVADEMERAEIGIEAAREALGLPQDY